MNHFVYIVISRIMNHLIQIVTSEVYCESFDELNDLRSAH